MHTKLLSRVPIVAVMLLAANGTVSIDTTGMKGVGSD